MAPSSRTSIHSLSRETLSLICWALAEYDWSSRLLHRHLPAVARTCRFLSEPALDILWHTLPSIWPLLLLLPEDLREVHPITPKDFLFTGLMVPRVELGFHRESSSRDFNIWLKYAARVHNIDPWVNRLPGPHCDRLLAFDVADVLQAHCPSPALPNLRSLRLLESEFSRHESAVIPTSFYLSSVLKELSLTLATHPDPDHLRDVIKICSQLAPRMEKLELRVESGDRTLLPRQQTSLRGIEAGNLYCLTSFLGRDGVGVRYDALVALGRLPHLAVLDIKPLADPKDWSPEGRWDGFFAALTNLVLDGKSGNYACCTSLLAAIMPTSLHSISLHLCWTGTNQAVDLFTSLSVALGSLPCPGAVNAITISLTNAKHPDTSSYHTPCIAPLLALHGLRSLVIYGCKVVVDNALLDSMSRAWPAIRTIKLKWPRDSVVPADDQSRQNERSPNPPDRPQATLAGLIPLALHCAELTELAVAIDMRFVPDFGGRVRPPVFLTPQQESKVETLETDGSMLGDSWAIASFLSLVFPRLEGLRFSNSPFDRWKGIEEIYKVLLEFRRDERRWASNKGKSLKSPVYP